MAIADRITVATNGDVRYYDTGTHAHTEANAEYFTVIEFHRFLQDLADDAVASGDDLLDITDDTPTARSTDNIIALLTPYNIDDELSQHLYDGSIIQNGGDDVWDGIVNYGTEGIHIEIIQDAAIIVDDFWNSIPNGETKKGLNRNLTAGISHRFMVKVIDGGSIIDNRRLIGTNREFNKTFGEFNISATANGNNTLALTHSDDLNNATAIGVVEVLSGISNTEGYNAIDVNNDGADEYFYSKWVKGSNSINDFYEYMKYLTMRDDSGGSTIYGLASEVFRGITHEIALTDLGTGTDWETSTIVTWTGGTGQLLAIDDTTTGSATKMWIQLLTGATPTGDISNTSSSATATVGTVTERTVSTPFVGASTGSALIGSYGFGVAYADLKNTDKVFDLTNTQRVPPNNVTFTVTGVTNGEDRILVGPDTGGGDLNEAQFTITTTALAVDDVVSIEISEAVPTDTPASGTIRVFDNDGIARRIAYSSYTGAVFTVDSSDGNEDFGTVNADIGNSVFISYIDALYDDGTPATYSFTGVYLSDRDLFIRVRDGGAASPIKTFEGSGTLKSTDQSISVIRTPDE